VACQVCHSGEYKNCYACHVGLETRGIEFPSRLDFRIGRNPSPDERHPWTWVLVRHVPIAPESFADWGVSLPGYASEPTWRFATPHNVRAETARTESCDGCHENEGLYLTPAYLDSLVAEGILFPEEIEANEDVVVESLPEGGLARTPSKE
jgi:thiosulfate/3-mercaptopyruvate sulfurtransferase